MEKRWGLRIVLARHTLVAAASERHLAVLPARPRLVAAIVAKRTARDGGVIRQQAWPLYAPCPPLDSLGQQVEGLQTWCWTMHTQ